MRGSTRASHERCTSLDGRPRAAATRGTCQSAAAGPRCGSRPLAEAVTSSAGPAPAPAGSPPEALHVRRDAVAQLLRRGAQVRARRGGRVVAVAPAADGTGLEVGRARERLADQLGADHAPVRP